MEDTVLFFLYYSRTTFNSTKLKEFSMKIYDYSKTIKSRFVLHNICRTRQELILSTIEGVNPGYHPDDIDFPYVNALDTPNTIYFL